MIDKEELKKELKRKKVYGTLENLNIYLGKNSHIQYDMFDYLDNNLEYALKIIDYFDEKNQEKKDKPLLRYIVRDAINKELSYIFAYILVETELVKVNLNDNIRKCYYRATNPDSEERKVIQMAINSIKSILASDNSEDEVAEADYSLDDMIPFLEKINKKHKDEVEAYRKRCKELENALERQKSFTLFYRNNERACMDKISELSKQLKEEQKESSVFPVRYSNKISKSNDEFLFYFCELYSIMVNNKNVFDIQIENEEVLMDMYRKMRAVSIDSGCLTPMSEKEKMVRYFSKIALEYLKKNAKKKVEHRKDIKTSLNDIICSLNIKLPDEVQKMINDFDNETPAPIPTSMTNINVSGDYVQNKHVENEVNDVHNGGTGINVRKR